MSVGDCETRRWISLRADENCPRVIKFSAKEKQRDLWFGESVIGGFDVNGIVVNDLVSELKIDVIKLCGL